MLGAHRTASTRRLAGAAAALAAAAAAVALAPPSSAAPVETQFNEQGNIQIPAANTTRGPASPYPSTITVAGVEGVVTDVDIILQDLNHSNPIDIAVLLVGPDGTNGVLMAATGGQADVDGIDLRLDQDAAAQLQNLDPLESGSFRPNSFGTTEFPAPAPADVNQLGDLDDWNGTDPNGTWSLFVFDAATQDVGSTRGWSLVLTTDTEATPPPPPPPGGGSACPEGAVPDAGFTDVSDANAHAANIDCVAAYDIAQGGPGGAPPTIYGPSLEVTRGQMASFIARLILATGTDLPDGANDAFTDDDGSTHEDRINQLVAAGVINGVGEENNQYFPNDPTRRDDMAQFIDNAHGFITGTPFSAGDNEDAFTDDDGNEHEAAINGLAAAGIVQGREDGNYAPDGPVRRDSMASFLARELNVLVDAGALQTLFP